MLLKDILGKPGKGIHFHIYGIAIMDVLATIILGYRVWKNMPYALFYTIWLFMIGEILHLIIGVNTTIIKWLKDEI